jgi:hypothetical protein
MNTLELVGRAVLKIKAIPGVFDYAEGTKPAVAGRKYRRFASNGVVFIADTEDSFCTDFDNGNVYSIDLGTNDEGQLSLNGHTTIKQELNMAKTEVLLKSFTLENIVAGKVKNMEELIELA